MALTKEQINRMLSNLKMSDKAKAAGVNLNTRNDKVVASYIDANNLQRIQPEPIHHNSTEVKSTFAGMPARLEESGLTSDIQFDDSQVSAIRKLITGRHVCLIGAAGSGKTTMIKYALAKLIYGGPDVPNRVGIRQLSGDQGPSIALCAFTGIASQVIRQTLPQWLHPACKTIHQLLEYKPADEEGKMFIPTRNAMNKLDHDIIAIDEASMLGLDLWHNLVDALRPGTRVILIGDLNQLKPVADATMFAYALSAGMDEQEGWTIAELTTIHRQKEPAANRIVDTAHAVLNGNPITWDKLNEPGWRVVGHELPIRSLDAHAMIVDVIRNLKNFPTPDNPERPLFDPYQDLLLCAGNGKDDNESSAFVQQIPLNESLSRIIEPPSAEHPVYIIDAGRETKKFAVGHRVMATKNESPAVKDRVTNGLTGRIVHIESNKNWSGNRGMFGTEEEVMAFRKESARRAFGAGADENFKLEIGMIDTSELTPTGNEKTDRQASHRITIKFANGAIRTYSSAAEVMGIQLAYAVTVHKAQGSQADTVVIIVHQAVKSQLSREWLYTGITRARRRVIVLYTKLGLSTAMHRQQIFGASLKEKVQRYRDVMTNGKAFVRLNADPVHMIHDTRNEEQGAREADDQSADSRGVESELEGEY